MSRRSQDIPIRPRYGLSDSLDEQEQPTTSSRTRRSTSTSAKEMDSSYSEIPFLAQYAGAVPAHALNSDKSSTAATAAALQPTMDSPTGEAEYDDDADSLEDNSNSKDSSGDAGVDSNAASKTAMRPSSLQCDSSFPYELERDESNDAAMRHFVAANLEDNLRNASPQSRNDLAFASESSTPSLAKGLLTHQFLQSQGPPQIDGNVLSDIEIEAQYLATSVDTIMENLGNLLHSISSITADNVEVHKNAVNKLTDCMDGNIKCMYTIMAKTEEISKFMKPTEQLATRIREIKRLVDMLDNNM